MSLSAVTLIWIFKNELNSGSMSSSEKGSRKSGLIYGYDTSKIRIWAPDNGMISDNCHFNKSLKKVYVNKISIFIFVFQISIILKG